MSSFAGGDLGKLLVAVGGDVSALRESMDEAASIVEGGMKKISAAADFVTGLFEGLGVGLSAGAFTEVLNAAIDTADEVGKMAQMFGVATEEMSRLNYMSGLMDISSGSLAQSVKNLSTEMVSAASGVGESSKLFDALDVNVKKADGTLKSAVGVLPEIADKFAGMADGATKSALAVELFGRNGVELIPALNAGGEAIKQAYAEAEIFSKIVGDDFAASADAFNDSTFRIKSTVQGLALSLAERLLPSMNVMVSGFTTAIERMRLFAKENEEIGGKPELFSWGDAAARTFALIADGISNALTIIEVGGQGIAHMAEVVSGGLEMLWVAGQRATFSISGEEFDRRITEIRAKMEAGVREADSKMQALIDEMLNRPTFVQAMEEEIAKGGGITVPIKPTMSSEEQKKLEEALAAAMAKGDASARAAAREIERRLQAERRAVEQLQSQIDKEDELTQTALTYREIVSGSYKEFSDLTKQRLLELANEIDLKEELKEEEERLAQVQESRMRMLKLGYNEAQAVIDQTRTAAEKMEESMTHLGELFLDGLIDQETAMRRYQQILEESDEATKKLQDTAEEFGNVFTSAFEDAVIAMKDFGDVMEGLLQDIARMIARITVTEPLEKVLRGIFKKIGKPSGGGGGGLMDALSSIGIFSSFAAGGSFFAGQPMMVGERGTELIYPLTAGTVVPAGAASAPPKISINVQNFSGAPAETRVNDLGAGEYSIDVMVGKSLSRMASDGRLDSVMGGAYGLGRSVVQR